MRNDVTVIDAEKTDYAEGFRDLFRHRELLFMMAWRDLRVRYAQTVLGLVWAVIQPLATLLVFTLLFGRGIKIDTGSIPYPVFALAGMSVWSYFSYVMSQAGNSIISSGDMIKKTYFPRLVIPLSKAIVGFVDFGVTLLFLVGLLVAYRIAPTINLLWLPFYVAMTVVCGLTVGIWLSALTIRFRDFQHVIPFMVQLGLYATPVAYPASVIPEKYRFLFALNPMAAAVEGFRWSVLGGEPPSSGSHYAFAGVLVLFVLGIRYFRKIEFSMADLV
ncbi:MAG: ABC transporter permease [Bdellovibrionales bacterium]|nr:ABC transporter permease [Bdellovibrionales bacterium]